VLAHVRDLFHVAKQLFFVDEVVRRFDHFVASSNARRKRTGIVPSLERDRKSETDFLLPNATFATEFAAS
jgi:hypothetical protein